MKDADKPAFAKMLTATMELFGGKPTRDATAIWWAALQRYSIEEVRSAFSAHVQDPQRGRYTPKPADLIAALSENDGRPNADEAWSNCPRSEAQTSVWTSETKAAFFEAAYGLIDEDPIAARMAFKGAYERHVSAARRNMEPVEWTFTLGHDLHGRVVLEQAVELGRLPREHVQQYLPPVEGSRSTAISRMSKGIGRSPR